MALSVVLIHFIKSAGGMLCVAEDVVGAAGGRGKYVPRDFITMYGRRATNTTTRYLLLPPSLLQGTKQHSQ